LHCLQEGWQKRMQDVPQRLSIKDISG